MILKCEMCSTEIEVSNVNSVYYCPSCGNKINSQNPGKIFTLYSNEYCLYTFNENSVYNDVRWCYITSKRLAICEHRYRILIFILLGPFFSKLYYGIKPAKKIIINLPFNDINKIEFSTSGNWPFKNYKFIFFKKDNSVWEWNLCDRKTAYTAVNYFCSIADILVEDKSK